MSSKILLKFFGGCLALFIVMGIATYKSEAQVISASGKTDTPASQIIAPVLAAEIDNEVGPDVDRHTHITITNTAIDEDPVTVHVQFLIASDSGTDCREIDFFDTFTSQDTHLYSMDSLCAVNDGADGSCPISISDRDGLLVVTPVISAADPTAKSYNHLHGIVHVFNGDDLDTAYRFNAVGRSAINLATGALLQDNIALDGAATGFETIVPDQIIYHYAADFGDEPFFSDLILVAISDVYGAVSGYKADGGSADYEASKICNDTERCISCDTVSWS